MTEEQMPRIQESDAIARYVKKKTSHFGAQDFSVRFSLNVKTTRPQSFVLVGF
jgi:DNA-directed RNA polymerase subunit H (RpoH/RPB5)